MIQRDLFQQGIISGNGLTPQWHMLGLPEARGGDRAKRGRLQEEEDALPANGHHAGNFESVMVEGV